MGNQLKSPQRYAGRHLAAGIRFRSDQLPKAIQSPAPAEPVLILSRCLARCLPDMAQLVGRLECLGKLIPFMAAQAATYFGVLPVRGVESKKLPNRLVGRQALAVGQRWIRQRFPPAQSNPANLGAKIRDPGAMRSSQFQRPGGFLQRSPVRLRSPARHRDVERTEDQEQNEVGRHARNSSTVPRSSTVISIA